MPTETPEPKIDFRVYIGIVFFRWQVIAVCFLYCLLGGVLYLQLTPKKYLTVSRIAVYRDPMLTVPGHDPRWTSFQLHRHMLTDARFRERVVSGLLDEWGERVADRGRMALATQVRQEGGGILPTLWIGVTCRYKAYARAFLATLIEEHRGEWQNMQRRSRDSAGKLLEEELARLEEKIRESEDAVIEYQRLHDVARVAARGNVEGAYLGALVHRRHQLSTELMMLESQYPELKGESIGVISAVSRLTEDTGSVGGDAGPIAAAAENAAGAAGKAEKDDEGKGEGDEQVLGWSDLRVQVARLKADEQGLLANLTPDHPRIRELRKEIQRIENKLEVLAQIQLEDLKDRHRALTIQLKAIEAAEYRWQARDFLARQRRAEFNRVSSRVGRFENNYNRLYSRLHEMRVSEELKAEHFTVLEKPHTGPRPVWPDATKILLAAVAAGVGSGFGLALLIQVLDNKVQTIADVEDVLGVPFLGGVPFWVHSGLEKVVRPIVTEEHSSGAIEAYRALRTSILTVLARADEKIVLVTSADAREGKTLTALNLAIMIAQMDKRVLLADLDMRRGRLHRSLGVHKEPGITDVLREGRSLREIIVGTRIEHLYVAPTGGSVENASELLESTDVVSKFNQVLDEYDYIVCDTSPVLRVTDTVVLARQGLGSLVYVARVNHTPKPLVRYSLDMLKDARILGLIMNSIEMHKISSLYYSYQYPNYAYYSNAYAYGYDHYYSERPPGVRSVRRRASLRSRLAATLDRLRRTILPME